MLKTDVRNRCSDWKFPQNNLLEEVWEFTLCSLIIQHKRITQALLTGLILANNRPCLLALVKFYRQARLTHQNIHDLHPWRHLSILNQSTNYYQRLDGLHLLFHIKVIKTSLP